MLKKIDHIGIVVKDLQEVEKTFADAFGLQPEYSEHLEDQKVRISMYHIGESSIEYIEPSSADSPVSKYLDTRGNAIHHIAYRVEDLQKSIDYLKSRGYRLIDESPRKGAEGKRIAFIHPGSTNGILIELCEKQ